MYKQRSNEKHSFLDRLQRRAGCRPAYLYVADHCSGQGQPVRPHVHMLIRIALGKEEVEAGWPHGIARVRRLTRSARALTAIANYMSKSLLIAGTGKRYAHTWGHSRGLIMPVVSRRRRMSQKAVRRILSAVTEGDMSTVITAMLPAGATLVGCRRWRSRYAPGECVTFSYFAP